MTTDQSARTCLKRELHLGGSTLNKAAATISFLIAGVLFLIVLVSFGSSVHESMEQNTPEARKKVLDDAVNGVVTIGGDEGLDSKTQLIMSLAGGGFLVAGFALWPKKAEK
jgi:hypothetical protein